MFVLVPSCHAVAVLQGLQGSLSFISCLEQQLQGIHGVDAVLAALVGHCQQVFAAGSKPSTDLTGSGSSSKAEAIDVSCLSSIQEQHSAARALPLLLRLYFTNNSRIEVGTVAGACIVSH